MTEKKQIVISKEDAVFWMDEQGFWSNEHGRFEHRKVIKYFNLSLRKDDRGYYVHQVTDEFEEKVYFPYEETAVFVVDIKTGQDVQLVLNIMKSVGLDEGNLFIRGENLYLDTPDHLIKFRSQVLAKLSKFIKDVEGRMVLQVNDNIYPVQDFEE